VITAPDKPVGRKQMLTPSAVKTRIMNYELGIRNKVKIWETDKIANLKSEILNHKPDLIVLAAFGQLIPKEILAMPKYGCLNIHPSLLPKYRGASPIQTAILNGDRETGVTIMLMDEMLDHGEILAQQEFMNNELGIMNYEQLAEKLAGLGAELLIKTIPKWINGEIKPHPQDESKATFTKIIEKEDGKIDWHQSAEEIERMIRAYNPWPGSYTRIMNNELGIMPAQGLSPRLISLGLRAASGGNIEYRKLKIIKAEVLKTNEKKEPGTVFLTEKKELAVKCRPARHASLQGVAGRQI